MHGFDRHDSVPVGRASATYTRGGGACGSGELEAGSGTSAARTVRTAGASRLSGLAMGSAAMDAQSNDTAQCCVPAGSGAVSG